MAKHTVAARCERRANFRGVTADTVWDSADMAVGACRLSVGAGNVRHRFHKSPTVRILATRE